MPRLKGWRRIANGIWSAPNDPQMYGAMDIDATAMLRYIDQARDAGLRLTPTHLVGRALACALRAVPDLNVRLVGMRAVPRPSVDIFFLAAATGGRDLTGVKVRAVDTRSALEVADELSSRARQVRRGRDPQFARSKMLLNRLPKPLVTLSLRAASVLTERYQVHFPPLGLRANAFGSAIVTSVGMFGIPQGFAPLAWTYTVPLLVLVGEICEKAVVVDHQVVVRPVLPLTTTIDHRYADGFQIGQAVRAIKEYFADPGKHEPALPIRSKRASMPPGDRRASVPPPGRSSVSSPPPGE